MLSVVRVMWIRREFR